MTREQLARFGLLSLLVAAIGCNSAPGPSPRYFVSSGADVDTAAPSIGADRPPRATQVAALPRDADPYVVLDAMKTVEYLASDQLEGRGVGLRGLEQAGDYIATRFAEMGLRPLPALNGYFQPFQFTVASKVSDSSSLRVNDRTFKLKDDYTPTSFSGETAFSAPAVFVGYGISAAKDHGYDDFAGIDVKGKVVIAMRYDPHDEKGKSRLTKDDDWSAQAALSEKAAAARDHGAVALVLVNPANHHGTGDRLMPFAGQFSGGTSLPVVHLKREAVDEILKSGGAEDLKTLQEKIDSTGKPASVALSDAVKISGKVTIERQVSNLKNVVGYLPGYGPRAGEYVVVGAHYDHLGRGGPGSLRPNSNEIHHGADDNASGTTALIELARKIVRQGRPQRSVIFVAFSAEEHGLIGSKAFVDHPPVSLDRIVAMLNMDMVGRIRNDSLYVGGAGTAEPFDAILKSADAASTLNFKDTGRGGFGPSDHMSFALKKIPVLFFFSGMHREYHTPADTAEKLNYIGLAQAVSLGQDVVNGLIAMPRAQYVATNDSRSMATALTGPRGDRDPTQRRASLGVIPDYGTDTSKDGVRISGAMDGSAAAGAGLRDGDVITKINDSTIESLMDLTNFLGKSKPGDKVTITFQRDGKTMTVETALKERGG